MFEYLKANRIDGNGVKRVWATVDPFYVNKFGNGKQICLENNYAKDLYEIQEFNLIHGSNHYVGVLERGKEETKTVNEFKAWLLGNGYTDDDYCRYRLMVGNNKFNDIEEDRLYG